MDADLLGYIFGKIEDQKSYFVIEYNNTDDMLAINMYDGSTYQHRRFPLTYTPAVSTAVSKYIKYGPQENWSP